MARKDKTVTIQSQNRDHGKQFYIEEFPPRQGEKFAIRLALAMAKGQQDIDTGDIQAGGWQALISMSIRSLTTMSFPDAEPLMDEMLSLVWIVPDANMIDQNTKKPLVRPVNWDYDVEEVETIWTLRSEVLELHTGFSLAAYLSKLGAAAKAKLNTPDMQTSPETSAS